MTPLRRTYRGICHFLFWWTVTLIIQELTRPFGIWHPAFLFVLNSIGPSTEYHRPWLPTARQCSRDDQRPCVYLGDEFYVNITVVRHKINGSCRFEVVRYAEHVNGAYRGIRHPVSYATLQFVGQNEMRDVRWPSPPDKYILGYAVSEDNIPQDGTNGRPYRPLLPNGLDEDEFTFFVKGRYFCNYLDDIFPRYIQGGEREDETASIHAVVRRHKP